MYEVHLASEVQDALKSLAARPLRSFAEFVDALQTGPYVGRLYGPGGDMRAEAIDDGDLLVVWLIPDAHSVLILRLVWVGDATTDQ